MKPVISLFALALLAVAQRAEADPTGVRTLTVRAPERGADLGVVMWYPAQDGGKPTIVGASPLFRGTEARQDAPPVAGRFPLVLLSHGSGGHAANLGWLASRLVAQGFVVAAPNHPGSTTGNASQTETIGIVQRTSRPC